MFKAMFKLLLIIHLWGIALLEHTLDTTIARAINTLEMARSGGLTIGSQRRRDNRGSVTIEQVVWAGAVIVIVGIVVAAITGYVKSQSAKIK